METSSVPCRVVLQLCLAVLFVFTACGGCASSAGENPGDAAGTSPSFSLTISSSSLTLTSSGAQILTVTLVPANGFNSTAYCNVNGAPAGINVSPSSFNLSSGTPQTVQFSLNNISVSGTSTGTVSCSTSGSSAQVPFSLIAQVTPGLLLASNPAALSLTLGQTSYVSLSLTGIGGVAGTASITVTGLPSGVTAPQTLSMLVNSDQILDLSVNPTTAVAGTFPITVKATSGTYTATATILLTISTTPDFSISSGVSTGTGIYQNSTGSLGISTSAYNGFSQPITITVSGLPAGVMCSPATLTIEPGTSAAFAMSASFCAAVNTSGVAITVTGVAGGITHRTTFNLFVYAPTITLQVQPSNLSVPAGSSNFFETFLFGLGDGPVAATITVGPAPAGVTITPTTLTLQPGQLNNPNFFVTTSGSAVSGQVQLTANYGPYTSQVSFAVNIVPAQNDTSVPLTTSDQVVRGDGLTPYAGFPSPNYLLYHSATNRFFSTDAYLNRLNIVDAAKRTLTATLDIPGAFGIDQAPDGSVVYVGTMLGDLYEVDPVKLTVLKRIPSASIGAYGFQANAPYALANGQLLLVAYFLVPGDSWVDGNGPLALWDPATNGIHFFESANGQEPTLSTCIEHFENITLTNNRTRVLIQPVLTSLGSSRLCSLDPIADTWNWSGTISGGTESSLTTLAVSADGNTLAAYDGYELYNLDPATLVVKNSFKVASNQTLFNYPSMFLSSDGNQVFFPDAAGADILDVFHLSTGTQTGWIPQANVLPPGSYTPTGPMYQAISSSGLAAGVMEGAGVGLLDTAAVHAMPVGSHFSQTQLERATGPSTGGTATAWLNDISGQPAAPLGSVYFGANAATSPNSGGFESTVDAVTPAGPAGPADVRTFATDGGSQLIPWGFSYGPWVLETTTAYATAEGGGSASLFGLGFGPLLSGEGFSYEDPPSDLNVQAGGSYATVDGYLANPYGQIYASAPPLPANNVVYTVPPGNPGTTSQIAVATSSGNAIAATGLTYLPATQQFPVGGALEDGVYDAKRDLYYFTDVNQIRVFSLAKRAWQTPWAIPAPAGSYGPERLMGLALSPDNSRLVIADPGSVAIYLVNPDEPTSVQSFALAAKLGAYPNAAEPLDPVVTNDGMIYYTTVNEVGFGGDGLYLLNTNTGALSVPPNAPLTGNYNDLYSRLSLSSDGSRIYFNIEGGVGYYDIAAQTTVGASANAEGITLGTEELSISPNRETIFASGVVFDSNLNNLGLQALDLAESVDADYVFGSAVSADGTLVFQPGEGFLDVLDGRTGSFRARVSLPFTLSPNFRALVSDQSDSTLVAITGATGDGIVVVDLNSLPEPQPLSYPLVKVVSHLPLPAGISSSAIATLRRQKPRASRVAPSIRHPSSSQAPPLQEPTGSK